jgi:hypothetical protein
MDGVSLTVNTPASKVEAFRIFTDLFFGGGGVGPHTGNSVYLLNWRYRKTWTHRTLFFVSGMILKPEVVARRAVEVEVLECCSRELSAYRVPCRGTHASLAFSMVIC